jgi:flagellar motility protein MotE (MotC chaperone)
VLGPNLAEEMCETRRTEKSAIEKRICDRRPRPDAKTDQTKKIERDETSRAAKIRRLEHNKTLLGSRENSNGKQWNKRDAKLNFLLASNKFYN